MKWLFAGLAFAVLVLVLARCPSRNDDADDDSPPESVETRPADHQELPRIAADTDWSAFDETDLEELVTRLEAARVAANRRNEFSVVVADGETIITDGYETGPGTFAFTYFTPEIVPGESGDLIQVSTRRIEVNVSGDEGETLMPAMTFRPGQRGGITSSFISDSGEETEGWSIDITADLVPGGISIKGSTGY